jgi:hypothetical protein
MKYEHHQFADIFPLHEGPPLWEMSADIKARGQEEPIVLFEGKVLDGRRRQIACYKAGVTPKVVKYKGDDPLGFVVSKNLHRRHLGEGERAMVASKIANLKNGRPKKTPSPEGVSENGHPKKTPSPEGVSGKGTSTAEAAKLMNVSESAVERAKAVNKGTVELQEAVKAGDITLTDAAKVASEPAEIQVKAVEAVKEGKAKTAAEAAKEIKASMQDKAGHDVPEVSSAAFANLAKFEALDSIVRQLQKGIDELSQLPGGEQLRRHLQPTGAEGKTINKSEHLNSLKRDLKFTRPHSVCPYCCGKAGKGCKGCNGTGWVTEITWKDADETLKAKLVRS